MIVLRREAGPRASLRSTFSLTTALRGAVMTLAPQPVPEFLSGHAPASTPDNPIPSDRPHVAFAPLPFIFGPHATGDVMGLAILLPATLDREQRLLCWRILEQIETLRMDWGAWEIALADAEERRRTLKPETWTQSHDIWSTVTPFVFDRFPQDPYGAEAEAIVRLAFGRAGLPEPVEVDLHYNPWHKAVPKASAFIPAPARGGKPQRYHCHVRAQFSAPIAGPVIAGAGRYYGYGLFAPLFDWRPRA